MANENLDFSKGDWIVHQHHGIGQIKGIDTKVIGDEEKEYREVALHSGTLWVPEEEFDDDSFRPLATPDELREALAVIQRPPKQMASNFKTRRKRINEVKADNSLVGIARLLRDMWARRNDKSLTNTEQSAWRRFTKRFLTEWSVAMGVEQEEARERMYTLLNESYQENGTA